MGILEKIRDGDLAARIEKKAVPSPVEKIESARPTSLCPDCGSGSLFWLDAYDAWHCVTCDPPRSVAAVRGETTVGADGDDAGPATRVAASDAILWPPGVLGVIPPLGRGEPIWAPTTSRQDRRDVLLTLETFRIRDELATAGKGKP